MKGGRASRRPICEWAREEIGEDPARFLATGLEIAPRVQGIQSERVLDVWAEVERDLFDPPREDVLEQLEARRQQLQAGDDESANFAEATETLVSDIRAMDDPEAVQQALEAEVGRDENGRRGRLQQPTRRDADDEPEPGREVPDVEYDSRDDPEYERAFNDAARIAEAFGLQQCGERLAQERARENPRPHVIDALEQRQRDLKPDAGEKEEVVA
jgi:hypothetical protein